MMRRGPLDRYPVESVLHEASAQGLSGCIEFHTASPVTLYLHGGRIYAAAEGVELDPTGLGPDDEDAARDQAVGLIASVLGSTSGWYYHDPLGDHPSLGAWGWELGTLLARTRGAPRPGTPSGAPAGEPTPHVGDAAHPRPEGPVHLGPAPDPLITLGSDAWAIVVELVRPSTTTAAELQARLGWDADRMADAFGDLARGGVLPSLTPAEPSDAPRPRRPPSPAAPSPLGDGLQHRPDAPTTAPAPPGRRAQRRAASSALDGGSLGRDAPAAQVEPATPDGSSRRRLRGRRPAG